MRASTITPNIFEFFRGCFKEITYQIYLCMFAVILFYVMAGFYNITASEFNGRIELATGASFTDYELTLNQRSKLSKMYHHLCAAHNLKRDFNTDYIVLKALNKYHIENTYIPLYEKRSKLYFYYQNEYTLLDPKNF